MADTRMFAMQAEKLEREPEQIVNKGCRYIRADMVTDILDQIEALERENKRLTEAASRRGTAGANSVEHFRIVPAPLARNRSWGRLRAMVKGLKPGKAVRARPFDGMTFDRFYQGIQNALKDKGATGWARRGIHLQSDRRNNCVYVFRDAEGTATGGVGRT